jgi:hypothetical protein
MDGSLGGSERLALADSCVRTRLMQPTRYTFSHSNKVRTAAATQEKVKELKIREIKKHAKKNILL